jgi:phosphatidylinositol alpha 1,6-mannosyltransferase
LDLVDNGRNGLLFAPHDAIDLHRQVRRLHANPELRGRLAAAARPSVVGRTWSVIGDELIEHYERVATVGRMAA